MEHKEQEELEREVQSVYSEKADESQVQSKSSHHNALSDEDLEQISGGLYNTNINKKTDEKIGNINKKETLEEKFRSY